jgi:predicted DNA-binding transcriptional regulator AlpA
MPHDNVNDLISTKKLRQRHDVSDMTIWRRLNDPGLNFPKPIKINRRNFWRLGDVEEFERRMAAMGGRP